VPFALTGFTAFATNLVLVARAGAVERFFGGLDRLYVFHRRLAVVTVSLLFAHGGLVAAGLLIDRTLAGAGWKVTLGALTLAGLLGGVGSSFFARMKHETFVRVQRGLGAVFGLGIVHALVIRPTPGDAAVRTYLVLAGAVGGAAFVYRSVLGRFAVPRRAYRVDAVNRLDADVAEVLLSPLARPLRFRAGQFAFLSIVGRNVSREPHPYSIASAPGQARMRFMVKALGDYTTKLQELLAGCEARVEGPYGAFWDRGADNRRQIWIAGGVGIAPFLSMAPTLDATREVDLYYCTEGPEQAHFIDELFALADANPRLRVIPVRKRSLGRITADDIGAASRNIADKDIFICGPPVMMHNLAEQFVDLGARRDRIHFEDFSFM
jgi:predicted ferric reductase